MYFRETIYNDIIHRSHIQIDRGSDMKASVSMLALYVLNVNNYIFILPFFFCICLQVQLYINFNYLVYIIFFSNNTF